MATQQNTSMISETSICNQALRWLGQNTIDSLDEQSDEAEWMDDNYYALRDAVLEERMWTFATARHISNSNTKDAWDSAFVHNPPPEWLSVFRVYSNIQSQDPRNWITAQGWRMEKNTVLAYDAKIYMWGIIRVTDTGKFSNMFAQALAARIAADAAMPFTEDDKLADRMWKLYEHKLALATARDGQQGKNERIKKGPLSIARNR